MEDENDPILLTASYDSTIKFWATTQPTWECKKTVDIPKNVNFRKSILTILGRDQQNEDQQ